KILCPDYEILRWDESNFNFTQNDYAKEAYERKKWAFVSDYARLKVLYDYGGIYLDTDVRVVRSFDSFLHLPAFLSFEREDSISTAVIGSVEGNKWIEELLKEYQNKKFIKSDSTLDITTNVVLISKKICLLYPVKMNNTYQVFKDVVLFPSDWFCCMDFINHLVKTTGNTYAIHYGVASWFSPKQKLIRSVKQILGPRVSAIIGTILHSRRLDNE
ncbi:MAG TPA: glycosyltransferase, partial [Clostridia bacterium]|nr:glycosyltransferase [Clostridia bacterium]